MKPPRFLVDLSRLAAVCGVVSLVACALSGEPPAGSSALVESLPGEGPLTDAPRVRVVTLRADLREPWGMDFLPDGEILVSERQGRLLQLDVDGAGRRELEGVPAVASVGQGGLMDVLVHPRFADNRRVFLSYTVEQDGRYSTRVSTARLESGGLRDLEVLFTALPFLKQKRHFGSRLLLDKGYLYLTVGDRGNRQLAQKLDNHVGKVMRLAETGEVPPDNPFARRPDVMPEIWSYGHRNPQGIALHPFNGEIWVSEHGPQGGDEINVLRPGANFGWPVITYGEEYGGGKIGEGTHREGMQQPLRYYVPSIGTSGMDFYRGDRYPGWQPSLLVAALRQPRIARLELDGGGLGRETVLLANLGQRVRDVQLGPDGLVYALLGDSSLVRLEPQR